MLNDTKTRIYSRLKLVAIDETQYWKDDIVAKTGKISQVFLYDERVHTHLCEVTPSYSLTSVGYFVTEKQVDDDTYEVLMTEGIDHDGIYLHTYEVDAMKGKVDLRGSNIRFRNSESKRYMENFEDVREQCSCNHLI